MFSYKSWLALSLSSYLRKLQLSEHLYSLLMSHTLIHVFYMYAMYINQAFFILAKKWQDKQDLP